MASQAQEEVDVVDQNDLPVGTATIGECQANGLLHRAIAVLVLRTGGKVLLQRRSRRDLWHPGKWTISCTGHVLKGETYLAGARRELREELGLRSAIHPEIKLLLPPIRSRGMTEWEWVTLFTSKTDRRAKIDPVELDSVEEVAISKLRNMLLGPRLTPDARIVLRSFFGRLTLHQRTRVRRPQTLL